MTGVVPGATLIAMGSVGRWSSVLTWRRLLAFALVLGGAGLVYAFAFEKPGTFYDRRVDELLQEWEKYADGERRMRVEGALVPGSLVRPQNCEYRFRLAANGKEIPVRYRRTEVVPSCRTFFARRRRGAGR